MPMAYLYQQVATSDTNELTAQVSLGTMKVATLPFEVSQYGLYESGTWHTNPDAAHGNSMRMRFYTELV